jgi:hypothetical protein
VVVAALEAAVIAALVVAAGPVTEVQVLAMEEVAVSDSLSMVCAYHH